MTDYLWATEMTMQFMERDYLLPGQTLDARVTEICDAAERILGKPGFAAKFKANIAKGWYSLATPVWTNFGTERGLPISCFGTFIEDNMESLMMAEAEVGMMTAKGGGTSGYFGELRHGGSLIKDNGIAHCVTNWLRPYDTKMTTISQGSTRRGNFSPYLPVEHKDIDEWLNIRKEGNSIQDLHPGVCISDEFMERVDRDREPEAMRIMARIHESRINTGRPYIFFTGNANRQAPDVYRDKGLKITHSNLCTEIMLHDNEQESFVCCLSSMNIRFFDQWKNTDAVELMVQFLDAILTEFIEKASNIRFMWRAVNFAKRQRAIGLGDFGWHSYFKSKMISMESDDARKHTRRIEKHIMKQALAASQKMALEYGEPELLKGYNRRHVTLRAIAPTKSSAFIIMQSSEGGEPDKANYYLKDLAKGKFTIKDKFLEALFIEKGVNTEEVWESILRNSGSVAHLDFLTDHEKAVFKTFREISPQTIILLAAERQKHIDQGQSINLSISPDVEIPDLHQLVVDAWKLGIKSLYYHINVNAAQEFTRTLVCEACSS